MQAQSRSRCPWRRAAVKENSMDIVAQTLPGLEAPSTVVEGEPLARIPETALARLLELLELAARRGAFELEEYQRIGAVYDLASSCLAKERIVRR